MCDSETYLNPPTGVCAEFPDLCKNGICMDVGDTHKCECAEGYIFNDDLLVCEGIIRLLKTALKH